MVCLQEDLTNSDEDEKFRAFLDPLGVFFHGYKEELSFANSELESKDEWEYRLATSKHVAEGEGDPPPPQRKAQTKGTQGHASTPSSRSNLQSVTGCTL
eukprot:4283334-Amphidinium_carterae.1